MFRGRPEKKWLGVDLSRRVTKSFFDERNKVVHSFQLECQHYWGNIVNNKAAEEIKNLNEQKQQLPERMKAHLQLCFKGFEIALKLIDHLPDKVSILLYRELLKKGNVSGNFEIKGLKIIDRNGPRKDIICKLDKITFSSADELITEIVNILKAPKELIFLIESKH